MRVLRRNFERFAAVIHRQLDVACGPGPAQPRLDVIRRQLRDVLKDEVGVRALLSGDQIVAERDELANIGRAGANRSSSKRSEITTTRRPSAIERMVVHEKGTRPRGLSGTHNQ